MAKRITLITVLEHIQDLRYSLEGRMDKLEKRLDDRIAWLDAKLSRQIDGIDDRLDSIEVTMKDQKHEQRIQRLEDHAGLAR